jgi:hypothetical protein
LGDAFLNKYYAAFDFENQRVGLAPAAESALDVCENDTPLDINQYLDEDVSLTGDPDEEEDANAGGDNGQDDNNNNNNKAPNDAVEVFDFEDAKDEENEDFDFSHVGNDPTTAPGSGSGNSNVPPPSHFEAPERQPVPHITTAPSMSTDDVEVLDTVASSSRTGDSSTTSSSGGGGVAVYVVMAALVALIVAVVIRVTRRRRQQAMFQETWREAERDIVQSHRNLNYRDHSSNSMARSTSSSYRDSNRFHDEEQPEPEFVLDEQMLNRMN